MTDNLIFPDSCDEFIKHLLVHGASTNTTRAYATDLQGLYVFMGPKADQELPLPDIEVDAAKYLTDNRRTWAPKTCVRKIGTFRSWAKWAGSPGFLADYRTPRPGKPVPHPLPEGIADVIVMLMFAKHPRKRALVAFTGLCGLRVGEALSVHVPDIEPHERTITVRGKGDKTRTVPVGDVAWAFILEALPLVPAGAPVVGMSDRGARALLTRLGARAGIERGVASHDMRATFATAAYERTKDLRAVQDLLGHTSPVTTQVYTGVSSAAMRAAAEVT